MIVGNGLVAKALRGIDRNDVTLFASGVADSSCNSEKEFERERSLLEYYSLQDRILVYISTCSVSGIQTRYFSHKKSMEDIARTASEYRIIRLPPIINSPKGLFRFISDNVKNEIWFPVYKNALRRTITTGDVARSLLEIIDLPNGVYDVASSDELSIQDIVSAFERIHGKSAVTTEVDLGNRFLVNSSHLVGGDGYIVSSIERHYSQ